MFEAQADAVSDDNLVYPWITYKKIISHGR